jgi:hypothetical protein
MATNTIEEKRAIFASYRSQARVTLGKHGKTQSHVDSFIAKLAHEGGETPEAWVNAAWRACLWAIKLEVAQIPEGETEECWTCLGSGKYWFSQATHGPCYRCEGKGIQTKADAVRNRWYDALGRKC